MKQYIAILFLSITTLWAQIPEGYYDPAAGLNGEALQQALHDIIDDHTVVSYGALWTYYQTTDVKPNGKVWDMYSDIPDGTPPYEFTFISDQCGNYSGEGSCYNREHSWPKSWFGDVPPMNTDIFHVVPSDGYVNGQRSNYPYGEVDNPTWTSLNGSKKGPNTYPGYSGTVFEPIDPYKGDFARIYFYMSTRYLNEDTNWPGSDMTDGAQLEPWAQDMMMEWAAEDPVSDKEIARNNDIYGIQNNRNPFVDHPEYVGLIWGDVPDLPLAPSDLLASNITANDAELNWTDNADNEDGYYLYQNGVRVASLPSGATYAVVEDLSPLTSYEYAVSCYNAAGESASSIYIFSTLDGGDSIVSHFMEDFESASSSNFLDGDLILTSGVWNVYQAGSFTLGMPRSGSKCVTMNDDTPDAQITTPAVTTLGTLSFYYYQRNGAVTDEFQIQKSINGAAFEVISTQSYNVGENYTLYSLVLNDTSSSVRMRIVNDNQAGYLVIDDLAVTQYDPVSINTFQTVTPETFQLLPAFPNPFNPEVTLNYGLAKNMEDLSIQIYNISGELIDTPWQGAVSPGSYAVTWNGQNQQGELQPSGIYIVKWGARGLTRFQRITLLR